MKESTLGKTLMNVIGVASVLVVQETYGHMKEGTLVKRFMKKGRVNVGREQTIGVKGCDQS